MFKSFFEGKVGIELIFTLMFVLHCWIYKLMHCRGKVSRRIVLALTLDRLNGILCTLIGEQYVLLDPASCGPKTPSELPRQKLHSHCLYDDIEVETSVGSKRHVQLLIHNSNRPNSVPRTKKEFDLVHPNVSPLIPDFS